MAQASIDKLIIENLADLVKAVLHNLNELQPAVATAMDCVVRDFIKKRNWDGKSLFDTDKIFLAPKDWEDTER